MNEHERIREQMSLASAGALDASEERELSQHLASCAECSAEFEQWRELGAGLRRLPTPQAPAGLVERTRVALVTFTVERREQRSSRRSMVWLVLFAWTTVIATWPVLRLISNDVATRLDMNFVHTLWVLVGITILGWVAAGAAAVFLGLRHRQERRLA
ncbi:MAG TPA: zf-HC2 domain-containing protein [Candidatus Acidoferrum sp.]|nr:zf-HC2 domain-containing protein [Candidatus Acidoferrum sp.]